VGGGRRQYLRSVCILRLVVVGRRLWVRSRIWSMGAQKGARFAPRSSKLLRRAHRCGFLTCTYQGMRRSWLRMCIAGGQGVAGSNPAVPTQVTGHFGISRSGPWGCHGSACALPSVAPTKLSGLPCRPGTLTSDYRESARPLAGSPLPRRLGRTFLHGKGSPVHIRPSRLILGNTSRGPRLGASAVVCTRTRGMFTPYLLWPARPRDYWPRPGLLPRGYNEVRAAHRPA
jgi:hypothetical protein